MNRARFTVQVTGTLSSRELNAIGQRLIRAAQGSSKLREVKVWDNSETFIELNERIDRARQRAAVLESEDA
jgi:hypothetical protein